MTHCRLSRAPIGWSARIVSRRIPGPVARVLFHTARVVVCRMSISVEDRESRQNNQDDPCHHEAKLLVPSPQSVPVFNSEWASAWRPLRYV